MTDKNPSLVSLDTGPPYRTSSPIDIRTNAFNHATQRRILLGLVEFTVALISQDEAGRGKTRDRLVEHYRLSDGTGCGHQGQKLPLDGVLAGKHRPSLPAQLGYAGAAVPRALLLPLGHPGIDADAMARGCWLRPAEPPTCSFG